MLTELIMQGFGEKEDLNCAEKILYGANIAYGLNLEPNVLKLAAGFGGGMGIEDKCGVLTASIMVMGSLFVENHAHEGTRIKNLTIELFETYRKEMGAIDCAPLKERYRTEEKKCYEIILKASEILDSIVSREISAKG